MKMTLVLNPIRSLFGIWFHLEKVNTFNVSLLSTATLVLWYQNLNGHGWHNALVGFYYGCILLSGGLQTYFLIGRWLEHGSFPLSNLYESLFFLSWGLTAFVLVALPRRAVTGVNPMGGILMPMIVGINGFMLFLPTHLKTFTGLVPALQSNWLQMHVAVMISSYVCLILGCLFAVAYLVVDFVYLKPKPDGVSISQSFNKNGSTADMHTFQHTSSNTKAMTQLAETWDNLSYRTISLGFPLLTMGLLSGAVWANQTWGSYWSWDPKETWALITWFVFAIYLHTRLSKAWNGTKSAWLALVGFITLWICYLGVNLMAKGLHSYGFWH